jgi:DNA-binding Xre family transcriptional regulator
MIRIKFKELISDKEFKEARVVTISEVSEQTGIHRATLSKIANDRGCNTGTDNLNKLCRFFDCNIEDLLTYIPD